MAGEEWREQRIGGPANGLRYDYGKGDCVRFVLQSENQKGATSPFLLNHQTHIGSGFRCIGELQLEIIAAVTTQRTPRQVLDPCNTVPVVITTQAANERSVGNGFVGHGDYSAATPSGNAPGARSSVRA